MARSDILKSLVISNEDCETQSAHTLDFHAVGLQDPTIKLEMKFSNIKMFRKAIRVYNLKKGKDILFKKNKTARCVAVCRDTRCKYRVYRRKMSGEESFQVRSTQSKHICGQKYRNSIVNST
jgi:hypothetical protein